MSTPDHHTLNELYQQLIELLKLDLPAAKNYLGSQLFYLPDFAQQLRELRHGLIPAVEIRRLERLAGRLERNAKGSKRPLPAIDQLLAALPETTRNSLLYHYADRKWGRTAAHHLGPSGDALHYLINEENPQLALRQAIQDTIESRRRDKAEGRGGSRRRKDEARIIAAEHWLEIYESLLHMYPAVWTDPAGQSDLERVRGLAIEYLDLIFEAMELECSRSTLRRLVDEHAKRAKASRGEEKVGRLGVPGLDIPLNWKTSRQ